MKEVAEQGPLDPQDAPAGQLVAARGTVDVAGQHGGRAIRDRGELPFDPDVKVGRRVRLQQAGAGRNQAQRGEVSSAEKRGGQILDHSLAGHSLEFSRCSVWHLAQVEVQVAPGLQPEVPPAFDPAKDALLQRGRILATAQQELLVEVPEQSQRMG